MEVHFTLEQEAQLTRVASKAGIDLARLVKDAALRLLQEDTHFLAAVTRSWCARNAWAERCAFVVPPSS